MAEGSAHEWEVRARGDADRHARAARRRGDEVEIAQVEPRGDLALDETRVSPATTSRARPRRGEGAQGSDRGD